MVSSTVASGSKAAREIGGMPCSSAWPMLWNDGSVAGGRSGTISCWARVSAGEERQIGRQLVAGRQRRQPLGAIEEQRRRVGQHGERRLRLFADAHQPLLGGANFRHEHLEPRMKLHSRFASDRLDPRLRSAILPYPIYLLVLNERGMGNAPSGSFRRPLSRSRLGPLPCAATCGGGASPSRRSPFHASWREMVPRTQIAA